jgi:acetyl-CoA carboxylase biotin carboxyl carrier protein
LPNQDGTWLEAVRRIVTAVRASDVAELALEHGSFRIRVVRDLSGTTTAAGGPTSAPTSEAAASHLHGVLAPLTGVFYRAPTPTARPYVGEGEWVDSDSVIGLIETMKIFNEVTADRPGRIVAFQVQSGQLVQTGDVLARLEPAERSAAAPEPDL